MENEKHGKYLGVDYGDVRTGLAVSDITGFLAGGIRPLCGLLHARKTGR